jgi:hypothetical protein
MGLSCAISNTHQTLILLQSKTNQKLNYHDQNIYKFYFVFGGRFYKSL